MKDLTVVIPALIDVMKNPEEIAWQLLWIFNRVRPNQIPMDEMAENKAVIITANLEIGEGNYTATIKTCSVCRLEILKRFESFGPELKVLARTVRLFAKKPGNAAFGSILQITNSKKESQGIAVACQPLTLIPRKSGAPC